MKKNYFSRLCAALVLALSFFTVGSLQVQAQQLPDPSFEDWSDSYNGDAQPKYWHGSNVTQVGFKFTFLYQKEGRTGKYCAYVADKEVGAAGITENAPGYFSLGYPWQYLESVLKVSEATAGTSGGIDFTYRPDSMQVWIKRTGDKWAAEDYHLLFYSWKGTAQSGKYKGKNSKCTSHSETNEESDIRLATDANECGTTTKATQVAEGWWRERAQYNDWTLIKVPIFYLNDETPEKCNVIISAGNYPNFRANSGLNAGNAIYADDIELIYTAQIQKLYLNNKEWAGFDPNSTDEQVYSVGAGGTIPTITAVRGAGSLTNVRGETANFPGRKLTSSEMTITNGQIDGTPTTITVKSGDGSKTMTYKIKFISQPSDNSRLAGITVNGAALDGFSPYITTYNVALPYGTTATPVVAFTKAEDAQTVTLTQATSNKGTATIKVVAADGVTTSTYTLNFSVAQLSDNTLQGIKVDGEEIADFYPSTTTYKVTLPLSTTATPTVEAISAYPAGAQTIEHIAPDANWISNKQGQYQLKVTTPGNSVAKVYKLNFKIEASDNSKLKDLQVLVGGVNQIVFNPSNTTYYVTLPIGTTTEPEITYEQGDKYQTVTIERGGLDGVTKVTVTAGNGSQTIYKIVLSTEKSDITTLKAIYIDGELINGFDPNIYTYNYALPLGATALPEITWEQGDEYQTVTLLKGGLTGATRITVTAGDGSVALYTINFSEQTSSVNTLNMIYVGGTPLAGFDPNVFEYNYNLPLGTTKLPEVTYDKGDEFQTVTTRNPNSVNGDYKIIVRPQSGTSNTYVIHFSVATSSNVSLQMIYLDGAALTGFDPDKLNYTITLAMGVEKLPTVTYDKAEDGQGVIVQTDGNVITLRVTAEDGTQQTYTLTFVTQTSTDATLKMIYIDGVELAGFSPDVLEYSYQLPQGTTTLPNITYEQGDEYQTVTVRANGVNGDYKITVRPQSGAAQTYTIHFSVLTSSNVNLQMIYLDGVALIGFSATTLNYTVTLPLGATSLPAVTYAKGDDSQRVLQQTNGNTVTLRVTAEDGTQQTYSITFSYQQSSNTALAMIYVGGVALEGFNAETLDYTITLPIGQTKLPTVTYDKAETSQRVSMQTADNVTTLRVTAEDGTQQTYTITFVIQTSSDATLKMIYVDGKELEDFSPAVLEYSYQLPQGTTSLPEVTYEKNDELQTVSTRSGGVNGDYKITVRPQSGASQVYIIHFSVLSSANANLDMIYVGGEALADFDPLKTDYQITLPQGQTTIPTITYDKADDSQRVLEETDGMTVTLRVTAEDGSQQTYTLTFYTQKNASVTLNMILVGGEELSDFQASVLGYEVVLPQGTTALPDVTYIKGDDSQRVLKQVTDNTVTLTVTAEDGSQETYSITFIYTYSSNTALAAVYINGQQYDEFEADSYDYDITLPLGETQLPTVTFQTAETSQRVRRTTEDNTVILTVTAEDGTEEIYRFTFTFQQSSNAELTLITLDGEPLQDFQSGMYDYEVQLAAGVTRLPAIGYQTADDLQRVLVLTEGNTVSLRVTAEDGTQLTYTIQFLTQVSANTQLAMIYLDGEELDNYDPATNEYRVTLPLGQTTIPEVTYQKSEEMQSVMQLVQDDNIITLTVTAQDGTVNTYSIQFFKQLSEDAQLQMIYLDGAELDGFRSDKLTYDYRLTSEFAPAVTVDKGFGQQVTILTPAGEGDATIIVTPQSGEPTTYVVHFLAPVSGEAVLDDIQLDGESMQGFNPLVFNYRLNYNDAMPVVTTTAAEGRHVEQIQNDNIVTIQVSANGKLNTYTIRFTKVLSSNTTLQSILLDGVPVDGYNAETTEYDITLPLNSSIPTITYEKAEAVQNVYFGQVSRNTYQLTVVAEDGRSRVYTLSFDIPVRTSTELLSIELDGTPLELQAGVYDYNQTIIAGHPLPVLTYTADEGQTTMAVTTAGLVQQIVVKAENGATAIYTITYTEQFSENALLRNILLDGVSLEGFDPEQHEYEVTLPWRTTVVPVINVVSAESGQTVTITYGAVNEETIIHVTAADGQTFADYTINFPVVISSNTKLADVQFNDVDFNFDPDTEDYVINLPARTTTVPQIMFEKAEREQSIRFVNAPIDEATTITVTAENGDTRTYTFTFTVAEPTEENVLKRLMVNESGADIALEEGVTDYTVDLPYGTTKFSVGYVKNYAEQTVLLQPGGVLRPTIITVLSNRDEVADITYTVTPNISQRNPATLESIIVNGMAIEDFDPHRFSYIVNVSETPQVNATTYTGAYYSVTANSTKHWQARVFNGEYSNIYDVYFYYPTDVIPNSDFTSWGTAAYNSGVKPEGWQVVADAVNSIGLFKSGDEVAKENNTTVHLKTRYPTLGGPGGYIPGFMTIGTVTGTLAVASGSTFEVSGGITFRNTPDVLQVNCKQTAIKSNNQIVYYLNGIKKEFNESSTFSSYTTKSYDLSDVNRQVPNPSLMNILINSFYTVNSVNKFNGDDADLYVDWVKFVYNNKLASMAADGSILDLTGDGFFYTKTSAEDTGLPVLTFTGEVEDQAQLITWSDEEDGVRRAQIRNFGEDGNYTDYALTVIRPLSTVNTLSRIEINGLPISGYTETQTDYTVQLPYRQNYMPDVAAVAATNLQTVTVAQAGDQVIITVVPEDNSVETRVYTINFTREPSHDVTLQAINAAGIDYDPATTEYTVEAAEMPEITFRKQLDAQTVTLDGGTLTVLAEDGTTTGTYTITLNAPEVETSGLLADISLDDMTIEGFNETVFDYTKPQAQLISFTRKDATDRVVEKLTPQGITFTVTGTDEHNYVIAYPTDLSHNSMLQNILVNGEPLADFLAQVYEYLIQTNEPLTIQIVPGESEQEITITVESSTKAMAPARAPRASIDVQTYTISVRAEDGTPATYTVTVEQQLSSNADLKAILVDGIEVEGFRADSTSYIVTLPTPYAKTEKTLMPEVSYVAGTAGQNILLERANGLGEPTYITVESEDESQIRDYDITVAAEASHNAFLSNILVEGKALAQFAPRRMFYSVQTNSATPDVQYEQQDIYQTVTVERTAEAVILHVKAEDGTTLNDYQIDTYQAAASTDALLKDITLNGLSFSQYNSTLADFSPRQNTYYISIAKDAQLPDIAATASSAGQQVSVEQADMTTTFNVVAEDGVTRNQYNIYFVEEQSANVLAEMIYTDGKPIDGFNPEQYVYNIALEVGVETLPVVTVQKQEQSQTVTQETAGQRVTVTITAENGQHNTYLLSFNYTYSEADTLLAINDDLGLINGYDPQQFYYEYTLPLNDRTVPTLSYVAADQWQTITADRQERGLQTTYRYTVVAASGARNIYTVVYNIPQSAADTLLSISDEQGILQGFQPSVFEYSYTMPYDNHNVPALTYEPADEWQTVTVQQNAYAGETVYRFNVKAENGQQNIYTVTYLTPRSEADTLLAINNQYGMIDGFDPHTFYYSYTLPLDDRTVPELTWQQADRFQTVTMNKDERERQTTYRIDVTAESGAKNVYTVVYNIPQSAADTLLAINDNLGLINGFEPQRFSYTYTLPLNNRIVPELTYRAADEWQTVTTNKQEQTLQTIYRFDVTAENGSKNVYTVTYIIPQSDADTLLAINDQFGLINGFDPQQTQYQYYLGDDDSEVPTLTYEPADEWQTVTQNTLTTTTQTTTTFTVRAENGNTRIYSVVYEWKLSAADTLLSISNDYGTIEGFNPQVFQYHYTLPLNDRTLPYLTYQQADEYQTVTRDTVTVGRETTFYFHVTAHNGARNTYAVTYEVPQSDAAYLNGILDEEGLISGFDAATFEYVFTLPTDDRRVPELTYEQADEWQTVTMTKQEATQWQTIYRFDVTAENGSKGLYLVTYNIEQSAADTLLAIYDEYGVISGFQPDSLTYEYTLPLNNRVVPELTYEQADQYQTVTVRTISNDFQTTYQFNVRAENGNQKVYTVTYLIPQSAADSLLAINDNRGLIEGFTPSQLNYRYTLPLNNRVVPALTYQKADQWQTVTESKLETDRQTTYRFDVQAENGALKVYTVIYDIPQSAADTLLSIDDEQGMIIGFEPHTFYYEYTLPLTNRVVPRLTYEPADEWQTVEKDSVEAALQTTFRFNVQAENGQRNIYTVIYNIPQSTVDTLREIRINNQLLEGFTGLRTDYEYTLPVGTTEMPAITYVEGDEWQTVELIEGGVNGITKLIVRAENGLQRIYTIQFRVGLSDNARLANINCTGLTDFDEYKFTYNIVLPYGTTQLPAITWQKQEDAQQVTLTVQSLTATLHVVAEDGITEQDYLLNFTIEPSDNAFLRSLKVDGEYVPAWDPAVGDYRIDLPYGTTTLPVVTWELGDEQQTVDTLTIGSVLQIEVVAGDKITEMTYTILFNIALNSDNTLQDLMVRGVLLKDLMKKDTLVSYITPNSFREEEHTYTVAYRLGTDESHFFTSKDVIPVLADKNATFQRIDNADGSIALTIMAEDGTAGQEYLIRQVVLQSSNSLLQEITANGNILRGFSPTTYFYEYLITQGHSDLPLFEAIPQDSAATIEWGMMAMNDTLDITCVAADGSETLYQVWIHETDLNESQGVNAKDVLIKHVPGTDIFKAYSIRLNTQIAIYDEMGHVCLMKDVPVCNPNSSLVVNDYLDFDLLYNVDDLGEGAEVQIPNINQTFYYVFFENQKHVIKSGKLVVTR